MEENYTLGELAERFKNDAVIFSQQREEQIHQWKENSPDEPLLDWMHDNFNLPLALYTIVVSLMDLKMAVNELREDLEGWK